MSEPTVAVSVFIDMVAQLQARGIPSTEVCRRSGLDPSLLLRPHDRIPGSVAEKVWNAAIELTGDEHLGLHLAEHHRPAAVNILGYVLLNCRTGIDALQRLCRFASLLNEGLSVDVSTEGTNVVVHLCPAGQPEKPFLHAERQVMETMAAGIVLTLRRLLDREVIPAHVWFRHSAAGPAEEYHRVFGTVVRFGQPQHRVALRASDVSPSVPNADPTLLALFEGHAIARLRELERFQQTSQRVLRLLAVRLNGTIPTLDSVAVELAMSDRQLQRELQTEGTSYQALLDEVRRDLAIAQLRLPGVTSAEVALLLGFSEASAFTRAFKRWTGTTPSAWTAAV